MYLQLFSSSADCSSVLQLYPTGLLRLYLVLNSSKSETNYIFLRFSWQGHGDPVSCAYLQHAPYKFRHVAHVRGRKNPFHFYLKVHLTPIFFSLNRIYLLFEAFGRKSFWIYYNPRFSAGSVARPSLRESGVAVADDVYPGTKNTMAPQSALCICSRKWQAKLIVPVFWD